MSAKPWFKFYVADFRAEMLLLTPAPRGAYISLLMYYWENEGLPDDNMTLEKIAGMRIGDWRRNRDSVRRNFTSGWSHPRMNRLLTDWMEKSNKRKDAALKTHSGPEQTHMQTTCNAGACQSLRKASNRRVRVDGAAQRGIRQKGGGIAV